MICVKSNQILRIRTLIENWNISTRSLVSHLRWTSQGWGSYFCPISVLVNTLNRKWIVGQRKQSWDFVIISLFRAGANMVKQADHNSPRLKGQRGGRLGGKRKNLYFYNFTDAGGSFDFWTNLQWFLLQSYSIVFFSC